MILGLSGASRCGKSTLAKKICGRSGWIYYPFETIKTTTENIVGEIPFDKRMKAQNEILESYETFLENVSYFSEKSTVVIDRTPLDLASYLLCDVNMVNSLSCQEEIVDYVHRCIILTMTDINHLFLLNSISTYAEREGKPPKNDAYQIHFESVIRGLFHHPELMMRKSWIQSRSVPDRICSILLELDRHDETEKRHRKQISSLQEGNSAIC